MCGICGIYYHDNNRSVSPGLIEKMNQMQKHRGPDDSGIWIKENIGLGQARLSIIDLSPFGHQPMSNEDGTIWITFNGEIYNYLELREGLVKRGHEFKSNTDTEVIIHLWEEKGPRLVDDLRGMFAIALWDDREKKLFLARDRIGKKPLYYANLLDRIVFGSEIKAILQDPDFKANVDLEAVKYYLAYQSIPAPYCAFKGVNKLPPAHYLIAQGSHVIVKRYWKLSYEDQFQINSTAEEQHLAEELIEKLREAVRIRLMSEVPLGAFLSGGIDSSIIVALMAGLLERPVKTFSIGFHEDSYNELPFARMVADRYNTEHHEFIVTPDAKTIIPELVWHYNEPYADSSAIPTYYVSKMARQFVTVVLTGDAGDENFAGYPRYQFDGEFHPDYGDPYPSVINRILNPSSDNRLIPFLSNKMGSISDARRMMSLKAKRLFYYYRLTHFHEGYHRDLFTPGFFNQVSHIFPVDIMLEKYRAAGTQDFLNSTLYTDFNFYLPDTLMAKTDIAGMTHSLEARMPMLDHKFVEFAARIPPHLKLKDGVIGKYIFKKAVEPYLPKEVIYRKKMGFGVPLDHWFRNDLKEYAYDTLLSTKATQRGYFKQSYIKTMLDNHQSGQNWQYMIWNLLMLELWHQMFIDQSLIKTF